MNVAHPFEHHTIRRILHEVLFTQININSRNKHLYRADSHFNIATSI